MAKRKKRIIDYVRCRQMEKAGQKPDKKTAEGSELYIALNDQLKIDLPKLYELTALLIQRCLACHHQIQLAWLWTWEMKLRPVLDDFPESMEQILPEFHEQYDLVDTQVYSLGLCNGTLLADAAMFLSPQTSFTEEGSGFSRPRAGSSRTHSIGSEYSGALYAPDLQRGHSMASLGYDSHSQSNLHSNASLQTFQRSRSSSQISAMGRPRTTSVGPSAQPLPHVPSQVNAPTFSPSPSLRPNDSAYLSNTPAYKSSYNRLSAEVHNTHTRTSGIYSSAMPMADGNGSAVQPDAAAVSRRCPAGQKVLFVCASLYDFPLDRVHMECGIPYHSYVQGEIFDVIAHKGELWLAKNQDDAEGLLGWIWEQHFVEIERP
ncbi:hypothetical protein ANO11243_026830 [Dothideomycetidae sp. 11243]|nr:hypothetical protein ANO11243_026830 [fungal sp. No.11243]